MDRQLVIFVVNQQPFQPDLHISANLRNIGLRADEVELSVQGDPNDRTTLMMVATMSARRRGFEVDFTRVRCTPYSSSDGIRGVAVEIPVPSRVQEAKPQAAAAEKPAAPAPAPPAGTHGRPPGSSAFARLLGRERPLLELKLGPGVVMCFRQVPAGTLVMQELKGAPPIEVALPRKYYIGVFPVTQAQWEALVTRLGARDGKDAGTRAPASGLQPRPSRYPYHPDRPVENVSRPDAERFCRHLSQLLRCKARLPSEAEWEWACRSGSSGDFCFGSDAAKIVEYALVSRPPAQGTGLVGRLRANAWGLYDVHGNVWEWCSDAYQVTRTSYPANGAPYLGVQAEDERGKGTAKGGSWFVGVELCRCGSRLGLPPDSRSNEVGFRVLVEG